MFCEEASAKCVICPAAVDIFYEGAWLLTEDEWHDNSDEPVGWSRRKGNTNGWRVSKPEMWWEWQNNI